VFDPPFIEASQWTIDYKLSTIVHSDREVMSRSKSNADSESSVYCVLGP
jgi:hypothetical protein